MLRDGIASNTGSLSYQYDKLPRGAIRTLVVLPGPPESDLYASLVVRYMADSPNYQAISYTRGPPDFSKSLHLPSGVIQITESPNAALRRFRHQSQPVELWADAVCINQHDNVEKGYQVGMMGQIYSQASKVLIWLGPSENGDAERMSFLHWLVDRWCQDPVKLSKYYGKYRAELLENPVCPCCKEAFEYGNVSLDEAVSGLRPFWSRKWFTRLWVAQENTLARRATFFCGLHTISRLRLRRAATVQYYQIEVSRQVGSPSMPGYAHNLLDMVNIVHDPTFQDSSRLLDLLKATETLGCFEPRDRIYALIAMCSEQVISRLRPDYDLPLQDLWLDVATYVLTTKACWQESRAQHPTLILSLAANQSRDGGPQLPWSWVPDFGRITQACSLKREEYGDIYETGAGGSRNSKLRLVPFCKDPGQLRLKVVLLSRVDHQPLQSDRPTPLLWEKRKTYYNFLKDDLLPWYLRIRSFCVRSLESPPSKDAIQELLETGWLGNKSGIGIEDILTKESRMILAKLALVNNTVAFHASKLNVRDPVDIFAGGA